MTAGTDLGLESTRIVRRLRDGVDLSPQYLEIWRELLLARRGQGIWNGRDRHVIEIWAHRLIPEGLGTAPLFPELALSVQARIAGISLSGILRRYRELYPSDEIGLGDFHDLRRLSSGGETCVPPFSHRICVEIRPVQGNIPTTGASEPWWRAVWRRLCEGWSP